MKFLLAIGAIVALTSGVFLLRGESSSPTEATFFSEELEQNVSRDLASTPPQKFTLVPNHLYQYGFEKKVTIEGFKNAIPEIKISGNLFLHVLESRSGITKLMVWQEIAGFSNSKEKFLIKISPAQKKYELYASVKSDHSSEEENNVLKDLLAHFFYFTNEDTVGKYRFRLGLADIKSDNQLVLFKTNKEYENPTKTTPKVTKFVQKIYLSEGEYPQRILAKELASIGEGEFSFRSQSLTKIHFQKSSRSVPEIAVTDFTRNIPLQLVAQKLSLEQHPEYQKIHWPSLLAKLAKIQDLSTSGQLELFGDLVKALKLDPTRISELRKMLLDKGVIQAGAGSPLFQAIVGALATNGSADAQATLQEIYKHPAIPQSGKGSILSAFTTTQAPPSPETLDFLKDAAEGEPDIDLAQGALFALGAAIEKTKSAENEVQYLLRKWQEAQSSGSLDQQLAVMDALGNSGRVEFFETISTQAKSASVVALRARATFALRGIDTDSSRNILIAALSSTDSTIRYGAASAIYQAPWNVAFLNPLASCSQTETDTTIRNSCQESLAKNQVRVAAK